LALTPVQAIGQMIILRNMICNVLSTSGRVGSDKLFLALENLNQSLINDLMNRPQQPQAEEDQQEQEQAVDEIFLF